MKNSIVDKLKLSILEHHKNFKPKDDIQEKLIKKASTETYNQLSKQIEDVCDKCANSSRLEEKNLLKELNFLLDVWKLKYDSDILISEWIKLSYLSEGKEGVDRFLNISKDLKDINND